MGRIKISALPETIKLAPSDLTTAVSSSGAIKTSTKITIKHLSDNLTQVTSSISASTAATASSADDFFIRQSLTGSNALFTGTITAQTLNVVIISSSTIYSTGSNIFGDDVTDIQQFTGSVRIKDSLYLTPGVIGNLTASYAMNVPSSGIVGDIALGTQTSGDYVASITAGAGLTGTATGEGSTPTLAVGAGLGITANADDVQIDTGSAHFTSGARKTISVSDTTGASGIDLSYDQSTGVLSGVLQNSSVTVSTSTGLSGGGPVSLGGTITLTNTDLGSSQNIFKTMSVSGQSDVVADSNSDTLTFVAGPGIVITTNATSDSIIISSSAAGATIGGSGTTNYIAKFTPNGTTIGNSLLFDDGTNVGVSASPLYKLDVNANGSTGARVFSGSFAVGNITPSATVGRIDASNDVVAFSTSDSRYKTNIKQITGALDKVKSISGVSFEWIEDTSVHGNSGKDIGVIAQEIEAILPEVVTTRENGVKAVKYEKIVPLLIEAIKDLQKQIDELKVSK